MDSMIVDTEAGEVLDVFALPGKVMVAEVAAGERGMFVAWHTITPDAADEMAARLTAAAERARR